MRAFLRPDGRAAALIAVFLAITSLTARNPALAATQITLTWSPNAEADIAGYHLYYATQPGVYPAGSLVVLGNVTSYEFDSLSAARQYYFVLTAVDEAGNESLPSAEISGTPASVRTSQPTVESAVEVGTNSIYLPRGETSLVRVTGTNFEQGATLLGPIGVPARPTAFEGPTSLTASLPVPAVAKPGARVVSIINPDGGFGLLDHALEVVKNPDLNQDCAVDIIDLNGLARAWHLSNLDPGFNVAADLNDDDYIDGDDLAILVKFIGRPPGSCP